MSGPTFNQNHSGSGDNNVFYGKQPFRLTQDMVDQALRDIAGRPVELTTIGDQEMGQRLHAALQAAGITVLQWMRGLRGGFSMVTDGGAIPERPFMVVETPHHLQVVLNTTL